MSEKAPELRLAQEESPSNGVPPMPSPMPGYDLKEQICRRKEKVKKHEESLIGAFCTWIVDHQIGMSSVTKLFDAVVEAKSLKALQ
jgi:hypothetical protein